MSTGPWDASSADLVTEQVVEHIWKVEFPLLDASVSTVPAWDVAVSLDGGRMPYGEATFKAPTAYIAETPDGAGTIFTKLVPKLLPPVRIWAGWRHVINGAVVEDMQILFAGFLTKRELVLKNGESYLEFTAQTAEAVFDQPNSRSGTTNVGNTWSSLNDAMTAIAGYGTPWYKMPVIVQETGFMNTPTAAQLSSWRALTFESDDDVMTTLVNWAAELGQWIRGNVRSSLTFPSLLISADPYPYRTPHTLPSSIFTELRRSDDLEEWANVLKLTAQWTDASSGDTKTKKKTYLGAGVTPGNTTIAVRSKDVTVQQKPSGGSMSATWPLALNWLRRVQDMSEVFYTGTARAVWYLMPRIHGLQVSGLGLADVAGPISSINFNVDQGTMSVAWNTSNTRT